MQPHDGVRGRTHVRLHLNIRLLGLLLRA